MIMAASGELITLFSKYIEDCLGLHFPKERAEDLERAVRGAAAGLGFKDAESCMRSFLLAPASREQVEALAGYLTVGETYFFREEKTFDALRELILPGLIRLRRKTGRHLRIWSAGCATGEEPYSIAILLHSLLPDFKEWNINILATDINPHFLKKAAGGIYGEWSFRNASSFRDRYFRKVEKDRYGLLPAIKKQVTFRYHNLAGDAFPSLSNGTNAMDVIFCRNVLMYFSRKVQKEVVRKLYSSLAENGWLAVSPVEMSSRLFSPFTRVDFPGASMYKKEKGKNFPDKKEENGGLSAFDPASALPADQPPEEDLKHTFGPGQAGAAPQHEGATVFPAEGQKKGTGAQRGPSLSYRDALDMYREDRYEEAAGMAVRLLRAGGEGEENKVGKKKALALLSRIYANQGRLEDALRMCEETISLDKLDPAPYYLLAVIRQEMGELAEASAALKKAVYLDPGFVLAYFVLGDIARRQGYFAESKKYFDNALSAMGRYGRDDLVPESDGLTAGRLIEIISNNIREMAEA